VGLILLGLAACAPDPSELSGDITRSVDPVLEALERYYGRNGTYPGELRELISGGYIAEIPVVRQLRGGAAAHFELSSSGPLGSRVYNVSPDGTLYWIGLTFSKPGRAGSYHIYRFSDRGRWEESFDEYWEPSTRPDVWSEFAKSLGRRFQESGSKDDLEAAFSAIITRAGIQFHSGGLGGGSAPLSVSILVGAFAQSATRDPLFADDEGLGSLIIRSKTGSYRVIYRECTLQEHFDVDCSCVIQKIQKRGSDALGEEEPNLDWVTKYRWGS